MPAELAATLEPTAEERLEQAEAIVRSYCGWHIAPSREETVTLRAKGGRSLLLPSMYVTDVTSVTDDGSLLVFETDYLWTEAGVLERPPAGYLGYAPWGYTDVVVEFTHGYEEVPADVTAVVQAVAQRLTGNPGGLKRETSGPFTEEFFTDLSESEMAKLRRYRIPAVA